MGITFSTSISWYYSLLLWSWKKCGSVQVPSPRAPWSYFIWSWGSLSPYGTSWILPHTLYCKPDRLHVALHVHVPRIWHVWHVRYSLGKYVLEGTFFRMLVIPSLSATIVPSYAFKGPTYGSKGLITCTVCSPSVVVARLVGSSLSSSSCARYSRCRSALSRSAYTSSSFEHADRRLIQRDE